MATKTETLEQDIFLTPEQLSQRWHEEVAVGTLANWRGRNMGPAYVKVGKHKGAAVLYRLADVIEYERKHTHRTKGN